MAIRRVTADNDVLIYGHGDLSAGNMINSRASFGTVRAAGAGGVELDVRRTLDDQLAVIHDPQLPDGRAVAETRATELPGEILLLDEALDLCANLLVNVEIKNYPADVAYDDHEGIAES